MQLIEILRENGGQLLGAKLSVLYERHPDARREIVEAVCVCVDMHVYTCVCICMCDMKGTQTCDNLYAHTQSRICMHIFACFLYA